MPYKSYDTIPNPRPRVPLSLPSPKPVVVLKQHLLVPTRRR